MKIDPRAGSGDLAEPLRALGIPAILETLEFGDAEVIGQGPEERPVLVGIEIKKLGDFLTSFNDDRFLGHQMPGLRGRYEVAYLLLEGIWTADDEGHLKVYSSLHKRCIDPPFGGPWSYLSLVERLQTLENKVGLRIAYTGDRNGTVAWLAATYRWWTKPWNKHESHLVIRSKELSNENPLVEWTATNKMRFAALLSRGVGRHKAEAASKHFKSIRQMADAKVDEWQKIAGYGKKLATETVAEIERVEK